MASRLERTEKKLKEEKEEELREKKEKAKVKLKKLLWLLLLLFILTLVYAFTIEPYRLEMHEHTITTNKDITENYNGLKIVHFSDLHYGSTIMKSELKKVVDKINSLEPDIIVFTGDLVERTYTLKSDEVKLLTEELKRLEANLGKYSVIGNHDETNKYFEQIMNDSDFIYLKNDYDLIYNQDNNPILIYGTDDLTIGKPNMEKLDDEKIKDINYRIILTHEPDYIYEFIYKYDCDLILSGHSHNGQVRLPFIKPIALPYGSRKLYKPYYNINGKDIYISNGIGTSTLKIRFNSVPSINLYRLKKK